MTSAESPEQRRRPGRPRKWATDAERARAYRQRKAEEHASVDELRVQRRMLKRQLIDADRSRQRAEEALRRASLEGQRLTADLERTREQLRDAQAQIDSLRTRNEQLRGNTPTPRSIDGAPALSRQQRRAMERNKRNRKH